MSPGRDRARFKGLVAVNARSFVEKLHGTGAWADVVARLPADDRATLNEVISAGWYPIDLYDHLHAAIADVLSTPERDAMRELGRYCAEGDLTTVHRLFLRMASPEFLVQKYGEYWRRYQTSGEWTISGAPPWRTRARLADWASNAECTKVRMVAYVQGMLDVVGFVGVSVQRVPTRASLELLITAPPQ